MDMEGQFRIWMTAAQAGDREAYRQLLTALRPWLCMAHGRHCVGADVDDLVQETLLAIHQKRDTYDAEQPFLPWVSAIARYKRIDFLRCKSRRKEAAIPEGLDPATSTDDSGGRELREDVEAMLARLPVEQAAAIRSVKLDGLTVQETALQLDRSVSWVKVSIHRALKKLAATARGNSYEP